MAKDNAEGDVDYTLSGVSSVDYSTGVVTVVFAANESYATISVDPIDDSDDEPSESVQISLQSSSEYHITSGSDVASVTITDNDDVVPTVNLWNGDAFATELDLVPGTMELHRDGDLSNSLTVHLTIDEISTATGGVGNDYSFSDVETVDYSTGVVTVVMEAGQSLTTFTVIPIDDSEDETNETVAVSLASASTYQTGGLSYATVTILDDDLPQRYHRCRWCRVWKKGHPRQTHLPYHTMDLRIRH